MKRTIYLLFVIVILASCGGDDKKNKSAEELATLKKERAELDQKIAKLELEVNKNSPVKATPVSVVAMQAAPFDAFIEVQAQITGDENVLATPQMSGVVKNILVRSGQRVSKGQTLATLDAAAIEQQIRAQDAQLNLLKQLYEKQQKLWAQNIGTQVQLLSAKAQYESALGQRGAIVAQKNMYSIKSPVSGIVDDVAIKEGDIASPGLVGIRVVSKDKLKAKANLGQSYMGQVKQGDPVTIVFTDINDSLKTNISYVAQSIDPISRSFSVEVKLANNAKLSPNMSCKMKIANYEKSNALVVPVSVIQKTNEGDLLYIAEANKAKAVIVLTGRNSNGMVEVLGGLKEGDQVITAGYEDLDNGEAVTVSKF